MLILGAVKTYKAHRTLLLYSINKFHKSHNTISSKLQLLLPTLLFAWIQFSPIYNKLQVIIERTVV